MPPSVKIQFKKNEPMNNPSVATVEVITRIILKHEEQQRCLTIIKTNVKIDIRIVLAPISSCFQQDPEAGQPSGN